MISTLINWTAALTWAAGATVALLIGVGLAVLPLPATVLLLSMGVLGAVLVVPWPMLLSTLLVLVGFVVGPLQYVGGFSKAFWLPYLMGVLIAVRVLGDGLAGRQAHNEVSRPTAPAVGKSQHTGNLANTDRLLMRAALLLAGLFAFTLLVTSLINGVSPLQAVVAGKEYVFLWSLPAAFLLGFLRTSNLSKFWVSMAVWLSVQLAVVVWQRFVVAPNRGGDAPWDAVVGLFAGKANGAGGSGTMAMVSLWAASGVVMAWRAGLLRWPWAAAACVGAAMACALAEVKVAVLLLPLLALLVLLSPSPAEAVVRPSAPHPWPVVPRLLSFGLVLALSAVLLWAHQQQFTASGSWEAQSVAQYIETTLGRNLDARTWADEHGQLTRLGAVLYWWSQQSVSDVPGWLIGHGIGAVRHSALAPSPFLQGLRFEPGRSSAVVLLWETGVMGLTAWLLSNLSFLLLAHRLLRGEQAVQEAVFLRAGAAAIVITLISLPYGADGFEAPHLAVMHLLGVGWIGAAYRRRAQGLGDQQGTWVQPGSRA